MEGPKDNAGGRLQHEISELFFNEEELAELEEDEQDTSTDGDKDDE